jgi:uncharacterized protein (TIGR02117 family)
MNKIGAAVIRLLKYFIAGVVSVIATYLLVAALLSVWPVRHEPLNCQPTHKMFIASNGVHLDIVLPVSNLSKNLSTQLDFPFQAHYVSFGWGDKNFYVNTPEWSDLTLPVAFKAVFLNSESAMHVTFYRQKYTHWKKVELCPQQLDSLQNYVANSFKKDEAGRLIKTGFPGYSSADIFYEANGSFSLFNTCNVWTNSALKKLDIKTSVWSPFPFGVFHHLPE